MATGVVYPLRTIAVAGMDSHTSRGGIGPRSLEISGRAYLDAPGELGDPLVRHERLRRCMTVQDGRGDRVGDRKACGKVVGPCLTRYLVVIGDSFDLDPGHVLRRWWPEGEHRVQGGVA